ncbi:MAG: HPP family protein [Roseovarius sp.]
MRRESAAETVRAGVGALAGLLLCGAFVAFVPGPAGGSLYLFAPLGASAVLIFAVPNSPLAQPFSAIAGNMVSALVAVAVLQVVPLQWAAVAVAVGAAIAAMMLVRALHPPGGAVALLAALDPKAALAASWLFPVVPVGACTAVLVLGGVVYNRLSGRVYPFRHAPGPPAPEAAPRLGLSTEELEGLLHRFHQSANLGAVDLGRLLAAAEAEAARHRFEGVTCGDLATEALITVGPETSVKEVARLFRAHAIKSLPVIDGDGVFAGIVQQADLMPVLAKGGLGAGRARAREVMRAPENAVAHDMPVGHLLNRMARQEVQVVPVLRAGRLIGILTRSDIIRLLLRGAERRGVDLPASTACG